MPLISKLPPREAEVENVGKCHDSIQVQNQTETSKGITEDVQGEQDSGYEDFDEQDECPNSDSDMEGSVMDRPRPKKASRQKGGPPALPQRSEKRASRILDNVILELKNLDGTTTKELKKRSVVGEEDPHELYLSSEEDASLSDDYENSILDLELVDSNEDVVTTSRPSSRKSQEDTARVVSFVMVGKPQIVEIFINASPTSIQKRHSLDLETLASALAKSSTASTRSKPAPHRPSPLKLFPNSARRISISSVASSATASTSNTASKQAQASVPAPAHSTSYIYSRPSHSQSVTNLHSHSFSKSASSPPPPRKSSRIATNLSSLVSTTKSTLQQTLGPHSAIPSQSSNGKPTHSFLNMDPFEAQHYQSPATPSPTSSRYSIQVTQDKEPTIPKTPTGTSSSAWKMSSGLSRTLSKARKPSMGKLNLAYTSGVTARNDSKISLALPSTSNQPQTLSENEEKDQHKPNTLSRRSATMPTLMTTQQAQQAEDNKVRYEDVMRGMIKAPPPPLSPKEKKGGMSAMMGLRRQKSNKGAARP